MKTVSVLGDDGFIWTKVVFDDGSELTLYPHAVMMDQFKPGPDQDKAAEQFDALYKSSRAVSEPRSIEYYLTRMNVSGIRENP